MKRKAKEFVGWGSKDLITFLESINVDVSESLSPASVVSIINRYINDKQLFHPDKKKRVVCDANLQSLFRRKSLNKHKISQYLDCHFAENKVSSEEDDVSEDDNNDSSVAKRQRKKNKRTKVAEDENSVFNRSPQSHYASICPENLNLIYLRKTLVQKLLEEAESEAKLTGSFVKIKSDPNDYLQKKPCQLMKVTGITRDSSEGSDTKLFLNVLGSRKPVGINILLESDITEEDCEGVRECIKSGLLKQPTIAELKQKAIDLHEERVKHWIARELKLLQHRIDQANEKGWRKELYEYLEAKEKLQTSRERLLQNVPNVIAADLPEHDDKDEEDDSSCKSGDSNFNEGNSKEKVQRNASAFILDLNKSPPIIDLNEPALDEEGDRSLNEENSQEKVGRTASAFILDLNESPPIIDLNEPPPDEGDRNVSEENSQEKVPRNASAFILDLNKSPPIIDLNEPALDEEAPSSSIAPISTPPVLVPSPSHYVPSQQTIDVLDDVHDERYVPTRRGGGYHQYLVHWSGRSKNEHKWISASEFRRLAPNLFQRYKEFSWTEPNFS